MIRVYAPASIGNIGVGFDTLGMAIVSKNGDPLGDFISIKQSDSFAIKHSGLFYDQLPINLNENIVFQCWKRFCQISNKNDLVNIHLEKNVPVGSGLGSSSCSIVAALMAMNKYYGCLLDNNQLLDLMGDMESKISGSIHFDNVAPCFLGGMRIFLNNYIDCSQELPSFNNWMWVIAYPGITISTVSSRSVLPLQYSNRDCIKHSQYLSGFIHACHTNQEDLAIRCMQQDIIAEPYRSHLLPVELSVIRKNLIDRGALSCGISGSGPTVFAVCNDNHSVYKVSDWLLNFYIQNKSGFVKVCFLDRKGAYFIME